MVVIRRMLKPTEAQQLEALWQSMANILWTIGERQKVIVVLPGEIPHIPHSHSYFQDSVTEKLYFFEFIQLDDLQIFLKRYLYYVSVCGLHLAKELIEKLNIY